MSGQSYAFRDRGPTPQESERIRLILSCFRDGSGQQVRDEHTEPGWRDFERATAAALAGRCVENKGVFDVWVPVEDFHLPFGLSCKTSRLSLTGDAVLFELHNSSAKANAMLAAKGIDPVSSPARAGAALVHQVMEWHEECRASVDVDRSSYLALVHTPDWRQWRLLWFPLNLAMDDPGGLTWTVSGKHLQGVIPGSRHRLWEWYGWSGGQLKFYPLASTALWDSGWFNLEDAPPEDLRSKAEKYFPRSWV